MHRNGSLILDDNASAEDSELYPILAEATAALGVSLGQGHLRNRKASLRATYAALVFTAEPAYWNGDLRACAAAFNVGLSTVAGRRRAFVRIAEEEAAARAEAARADSSQSAAAALQMLHAGGGAGGSTELGPSGPDATPPASPPGDEEAEEGAALQMSDLLRQLPPAFQTASQLLTSALGGDAHGILTSPDGPWELRGLLRGELPFVHGAARARWKVALKRISKRVGPRHARAWLHRLVPWTLLGPSALLHADGRQGPGELGLYTLKE